MSGLRCVASDFFDCRYCNSGISSLTLFIKSRQQMMNTPAFKEALHYKLTEEGIEVSQGEVVQFQKWEDMHKAVSTSQSLIVYTSA